jgi:hypothetical protein
METIVSKPQDDFKEIDFGDIRITKRLDKCVEQKVSSMKESILGGAKNRSEAKAIYRLLGNTKFKIDKLEEAVKKASIARMLESGIDTVLLIQDTTCVNLNGHKKTDGLGYCSNNRLRGIEVHSCIAIATDGTPIGLISQEYLTREYAKNPMSEKEREKLPIEEKESFRWLNTLRKSVIGIPENIETISICDREGDFYELYADAERQNEKFLIRVIHNRYDDNGDRILNKVRRNKSLGSIVVEIPRNSRKNEKARQAIMEISYCKVSAKKPNRLKTENIPESLSMNIVRIAETNRNEGLEWILATNLQIQNAEDCMKVVKYYLQRWKIERFHYVLKSGCQVEKIQQRTYERIKPTLFIYSVVAMYVMALTYAGRLNSKMPCDVFFDEMEWKMLYRFANKVKTAPETAYSIKEAIQYLGCLGGYKHSPSDGEYGLKVIWLGLVRLYQALDLLMGQV